MIATKLIGRDKECEILQECMNSSRSEFVTICGRRRIGKTFLIEQFFNSTYDFSFVGMHNSPTRVQLADFARRLRRHTQQEYKPFADWYAAFYALEDYLESLPDRKKVVFIDEMPWIDTQRSDFVNALENFWNGWANSRNDIVFIASGSATSWMADRIIANQGGLHNRITRQIFLEPFTLKETEQFFADAGCDEVSRYDIVQYYMLTGGVPFYLCLVNPALSFPQNVDELCFSKHAPFAREYNELFNALFSKADAYIKVVELLNAHKTGLTRKEISEGTKMNGSFLNTILANLEQCGFIEAYAMFGSKSIVVYKLIDFYTLFYLKFIATNTAKDENWWVHHLDSQSVISWRGLAFERVCLRHSSQIKKALGISGMATSISTWKCAEDKEAGLSGAQVDMIIERADRIIHLCEMKFTAEQHRITKDDEQLLRNRLSIFKYRTNTKKAIVHTFVTTYGLAPSKHNSLVHSSITIDDLFV